MTGGVRFGLCTEEGEGMELLSEMERVAREDSWRPRRAFTPASLRPPPRPERVHIRRPTKITRLRQSTHTRTV